MALEFQWDPIKAASNVSKHGVAFADAATAFADPMSITIPIRCIHRMKPASC